VVRKTIFGGRCRHIGCWFGGGPITMRLIILKRER
jgi:hypothetical protein